ncbi:hypothetical protein QBC46DRAFT_370661 [Diplogelasinospora grovesii]|uniref:Fungal-type protein kinase domain-containing protein n=1 Tax=Diplogelasinospora grovesii TaxID=303347 RepID=A0AAN6NIA1_9PEZI|nr:hypothetical protein QBC46DRAFT_370661 [Diplogelasinospora grovesii]
MSGVPRKARLLCKSASGRFRSTAKAHRHVILRDYGKPIYKASSQVALLGALEGFIEAPNT